MRFAQQWHSELGCSGLQIAVKLESQPRRKGILAASRIEEIGKGEVEGSLEGSWTCLSKVGQKIDQQEILQEKRARLRQNWPKIQATSKNRPWMARGVP